ncbi:MAG TPA: hypothetical protein VHN79_06020 [Lacunisphaera sp.]|nr:hypothetical protein [Lacunisphaera sp.]
MTPIPEHLQRLAPARPRTRYKAILRGPRYRPQRYVVRASAAALAAGGGRQP